MGIAPIAAYPMPAAADLPEPVVDWWPDPRRAVLLVHDMQRYFLSAFPAGRPPLADLLANAQRLLAYARQAGLPVVYTAQPGGMTPAERGLVADFWGPGMSTDESERGIMAELAPEPGDVVLTKWRYSAFHASPLAGLLAAAGRDQMLLCGVFANIGCLMTASDAFAHDVQPFLVADAVADFDATEHRMALEYAARRCAAVRTTEQVLMAMAATPVG